jgi:hypothetical protein
MKMLQLAVRLILAGLLLLGLAAGISFASFQAGFNARCKTGNIMGAATRKKIEQARALDFAWMGHALACKVGSYEVVIPNDPAPREEGFILRRGHPLLFVDAQDTQLFDTSGQRILFSSAGADSKSVVTYSGFDPAKDTLIEHFDFGADGVFDYRLTELNGRRVKQEYRVGEQWLEAVQRDGLTGVVFDGRFMPVADAIKLEQSKTGSK